MREKLRISGGSRRGRTLRSPGQGTIRPASDFIRQAVFNMLGAAIVDAVFYDVFAGTGIVGLEALSRGARRAVFVERDRRFVALIRQNLDRAKFGPEAEILGTDAFSWARHFQPYGGGSPLGPSLVIVFLGPPYDSFRADEPAMLEMVETLQQRLLESSEPDGARQGCLILQYPREVDPARLPGAPGWYRMRVYGKTRIGIWRAEGSSPDSQLGADDGASDE